MRWAVGGSMSDRAPRASLAVSSGGNFEGVEYGANFRLNARGPSESGGFAGLFAVLNHERVTEVFQG